MNRRYYKKGLIDTLQKKNRELKIDLAKMVELFEASGKGNEALRAKIDKIISETMLIIEEKSTVEISLNKYLTENEELKAEVERWKSVTITSIDEVDHAEQWMHRAQEAEAELAELREAVSGVTSSLWKIINEMAENPCVCCDCSEELAKPLQALQTLLGGEGEA